MRLQMMNDFEDRFNLAPEEELIDEKYEEHETLNPQLFNSDDTLKDEVLNKLMQIVEAYVEDSEFIGMDDVITAHFVGSNASYNYTDKSDIDLHIVVDLAKLSSDPLMAQIAANGEKALFNKRYNININGCAVEVYVEDKTADLKSQGVYDIYENAWVRHPQYAVDNNKHFNFDFLLEQTMHQCESLAKSSDVKQIQSFINSLYGMRKASLSKYGEPGDGNQVFKELRNIGYIDMLRDRVAQIKSTSLSLSESLKESKNYNQIIWKIWIPNSFLSNGHKCYSKGYAKDDKQAEKRIIDAIKKYMGGDGLEEYGFNECQMSSFSSLKPDVLDFNPYEIEDSENILISKVYYPRFITDVGDIDDIVITVDYLDNPFER